MYLYMHTYMRTLVSLFLFGVCDASILVVVICTLLFSVVTAVVVTRYFVCTTPRRGGLWFGTARYFRAEQVVSQGRFRSFKAVNGGGWRNKRSSRINSDSLRVQVGPVVPTP